MLFFTAVFYGCSGSKKEVNPPEAAGPVILRKDPEKKAPELTGTAPIINISDTVTLKLRLIVIKDTASSSVELSRKLSQIYSVRLPELALLHKLKITGPPIAWYKTQKPPFVFEAGFPVDKNPGKLPRPVQFREMGGDSALIAHFYGPYDQTFIAYEALQDQLKERNLKLLRPAYEVYVNDPIDQNGKAVDPYKVQTDIIFPYH